MASVQLPPRESLPRKKIRELQVGCFAIYYRDDFDSAWVKQDTLHHFPVEIDATTWKMSGNYQTFNPEEEVSVIRDVENLAGCAFSFEVPYTSSVEEFRKAAELNFGHKVHIRFKIGPAEAMENGYTFPIEAVDDVQHEGPLDQRPTVEGHYLLIGYFV